ncbi:NADP(H)-dependent aldo-keto reductase [Nitrincola iocasae]|uniref:Protein tas n=1 Tax=Nitrincola iocasae TaxID=2614693 RepID=A0A5J6LDI0_9GAMM|nr:NADP(H)-dependent aldo-keto reductase [Nitrincola iocasae]QEW06388.1 NADP(H)-dependent aldo-keto reductase [Nitrincola iocasae]
MQYRPLGKTDLTLSALTLGTMTWGEQNTEKEAHAQIDRALDAGINCLDAAEMYPVPPKAETQGRTEAYIGSWLASKQQRDRVIIATKITGPGEGFHYLRNGTRLNREQVIAAADASLKRLQTDYIDLYQIHWPERQTNFFGKLGYRHQQDELVVPIEETLRACEELVSSGKVRHIGISNETPWGLHEYLRLSEAHGLPRVVSVQNPYNLLNRTYEVGLAEMSIREQVGLLAYSPLAFGVLSGKYLDGQRPTGARLTLYERFQRYTSPLADKVTAAYVELAQQHNLSPTQMALAFVTQQPFVTSNIIGATSLEQLQENIDSSEVHLSDELLNAIEQIHTQHPNPCP